MTDNQFINRLLYVSFGVLVLSLGRIQSQPSKNQYTNNYALLIGNSAYEESWGELPGARRDILELEQSLLSLGFEVVTGYDFGKFQLDSAFSAFIEKYGVYPEARLLFYFAGHGHTVTTSYGDELGYLVPIDAEEIGKGDFAFQRSAMEMAQIEIYAKRIQSKHALFVFDACFAGSIFSTSRSGDRTNQYYLEQPVRQFIASGDALEQVPDDSFFQKRFLQAINTKVADGNDDGFVTGTELGEYLQEKVISDSKARQHPQYGKIRNPALDKGEFLFDVSDRRDLLVSAKSPIIGNIERINTKGSLSVVSELEGEIWLDGALLGRATKDSVKTITGIEAGRYWVEIRGLENWSGSMDISAGKTSFLKVSRYTNKADDFEFTKMIYVEGGTFSMGKRGGSFDQEPEHMIRLDAFEIAANEVSVGEFREFVAETGYITEAEKSGGESLIFLDNSLQIRSGLNWRFSANGQPVEHDTVPVVFITWQDANRFTEWVTQKYGSTFRLPTEAEWEFAAGGGIRNPGDSMQIKDIGRTNVLGISNMIGGVSEWCYDWYDKNYYRQSSPFSPKGPAAGDFKVIRGGSWFSDSRFLSIRYRSKSNPGHYGFAEGFRIVRELD